MGINYDLPPEAQLNLENPVVKNAFILSSHGGGKGLLYANEPYRLFKDGALFAEGVTDDKAAILYEHQPGATYKVETLSGHQFSIAEQPQTNDRQKILARSLSRMGFRSHVQKDEGADSQEILHAYFKRHTEGAKK